MMLMEWEMLMFFLIVLMMLKMLEEICVVEDLMIGWLGLFIVKKKNLTKKIFKDNEESNNNIESKNEKNKINEGMKIIE